MSTDTLIEGVHFLANVDPAALGHKSLAVNLSDLAACGATPRCFFLAIALPRVDERWLADFSRGLYALADVHRCALAGGDTTRSPNGLMITITAMGTVPAGRALMRSGAQVGDDIWVTGELGNAALGLAFLRGEIDLRVRTRSRGRQFGVADTARGLGQRLLGVASSAIDLSDGLVGDMSHVLRSSGVGAVISGHACRALCSAAAPDARCSSAARCRRRRHELLFTAPAPPHAEVIAAAAAATTPVTQHRRHNSNRRSCGAGRARDAG